MNLVLVEPDEIAGTRATIGGRRAAHIATIHRAEAGRTLRAGVIGGLMGSAVVVEATPSQVVLELALGEEPPPPLACTLVLALPRPVVLRRILAALAAFGIKDIVLAGSSRVEKSYWQSPVLGEAAVREALVYGLEQGGDTIVPRIDLRRRLRPYVEDELAPSVRGRLALLAHPEAAEPCPRATGEHVVVAVGPEGGFVDFEVELFRAAGFRAVTLGRRALRVETAIAALMGRLF